MECFSTIVGTSFRDSEAKHAVNDMANEYAALGHVERQFRLEREPNNQYDPLAIKVLLTTTLEYKDSNGAFDHEIFIGYLAKANNATIAVALDDGAQPEVQVIDFDGRKPVVKVSW